ncbi:hypothetical protein BJX61DRAFT_543663 [Aspergillus egyptiacus]|nr:hypothetical protein BJX61DRAFT_543663 [Aspergillus egyptiacus]
MSSDSPKVDLSTFLAPSTPTRVNRFWFQHVANDQNLLTLPDASVFKPWFSRDAIFDLECATQFKPILEAVHQSWSQQKPQTQAQVESQANEILALVSPSSGLDWLGLVLLFDQLPRNCYRGTEAALVYTFFDPIARTIASRALGLNIPSSSADIRYRLALRFWFYLPLMHSEDLGHQELVLEKYWEHQEDVRRFIDGTSVEGMSEQERGYHEILSSNREAVEGILAYNLKFQKEHHDLIARFGRYPYRNQVLGRTSTPEEEKFLREENISFA